MTKFLAILYDSFLEIKVRKIFYLYWIVALINILIIALLPDLQINGTNIMESEIIPPEFLNEAISHYFGQFFGFFMLLMVFGTAGLVPSFLSKGRVELALSKPINRFNLLIMKFFAVFVIQVIVLAIVSILIWLTIVIRIGTFPSGFFYGLIYAALQFLIIYSIVFFLGLWSNSAGISIMGYFMIYFAGQLLSAREAIYSFLNSQVWENILDTTYHILAKISQISDNYVAIMSQQGRIDYYPVWSSLLFGAILLLLGMLIFKRRDY
jgi:ABC-type transport system involved in multi-copper enzyme maturation permease subunit